MSQAIQNPWNKFVKENYNKAKLALVHENYVDSPAAVSLLLRELYRNQHTSLSHPINSKKCTKEFKQKCEAMGKTCFRNATRRSCRTSHTE